MITYFQCIPRQNLMSARIQVCWMMSWTYPKSWMSQCQVHGLWDQNFGLTQLAWMEDASLGLSRGRLFHLPNLSGVAPRWRWEKPNSLTLARKPSIGNVDSCKITPILGYGGASLLGRA